MQKIALSLLVLALPAFANLDVISYRLKGNLDWEKKRLEAVVKIVLITPGPTVTLDAKVSQITAVKDVSGNPLPFTFTSPKLEVTLLRSGRQEISVEYETDRPALHIVPHRKGDPIPGRVAFTLSEPLGAPEWLPCHDTPSDRAYFSAEFTVPSNEMLIANGHLEIDTTSGDLRTMRYRTHYTLPTYLMAFALGDFTQVTHYHAKLPVKVFARPGLPVDYEGVLKNIVEQLTLFEKLLGPYPFEKYALVILPEHKSGMEHAGITFQGEIRSTQGQIGHDYSLTAHELAHQWFGNLVTLPSWDDLWIKEGMATLLAEEAQRRFEDGNQSGRLFGHNFDVTEGEAIRDPALAPDDKYNDGPYGRSAWLLTQIRALLGEEKFWGAMRDVLTRYRFESIGTDEFLRVLPVTQEVRDAIYRALAAKKLPQWSGNGVEVLDPEGALLSPLTPQWLLSDGKISESEVENAFLVPDHRDSHPLRHFKGSLGQLIPPTEDHLPGFLGLGAHVPLLALQAEEMAWPLTASLFLSFFDRLPSEQAKFSGLRLGCRLMAEEDSRDWEGALEKALRRPPLLGFPDYDPETALSVCGTEFPERLFERQWKEMETKPSSALLNESELVFLSSFALSPERALSSWGNLAQHGATVRAKRLGLLQLTKHYQGIGEFPMPSVTDRPKWEEFFKSVLSGVEVTELTEIANKALSPPKNSHLKRSRPIIEQKVWNKRSLEAP